MYRPFAISLLLVLLLATCGEGPPVQELRIGVIAPFTSPVSDIPGTSSREGAGLAVQEFNEAGGLIIDGQPYSITLIFADDQATPEIGVEMARKLILQDHVIGLIGPQYSAVAIPAGAVAEDLEIPMISPMSTHRKTTEGRQFVFRAGFTDAVQGQALAQFALGTLKKPRVAVLYDVTNEYNRSIAEIFQHDYTTKGGLVVAFEPYTKPEDYQAALERIHTTRPDALLLPNFPDPTIEQAILARTIGITATLLGTDGWSERKMALEPAFDHSYFTQHWSTQLDTPESQTFIENYTARYNHAPSVTAASTYDATNMFLAALRQSQSINPRMIRDTLANLQGFVGVTGPIRYDGTGDPQKQVVVMHISNETSTFFEIVSP